MQKIAVCYKNIPDVLPIFKKTELDATVRAVLMAH
jgi:hypothetical protein